jgi:hypothetical protein
MYVCPSHIRDNYGKFSIWLFKRIQGGQLMHLFTKVMGQWPIKRRDDDNNNVSLYKVIPAYEYHFYTVSTFSRSNPQVR